MSSHIVWVGDIGIDSGLISRYTARFRRIPRQGGLDTASSQMVDFVNTSRQDSYGTRTRYTEQYISRFKRFIYLIVGWQRSREWPEMLMKPVHRVGPIEPAISKIKYKTLLGVEGAGDLGAGEDKTISIAACGTYLLPSTKGWF